jgi:hypothetical protein
LNPYIIGHYRLEVVNNVFNGVEYIMSYRPATSRMISSMVPPCQVTWHYSSVLRVVNRIGVII